jgi:hypothetical protein
MSSQDIPLKGELEGSLLRLGKDPDAGEGPHQAIERARFGTDRVRQRINGLRAVIQAVGEAEFGRTIWLERNPMMSCRNFAASAAGVRLAGTQGSSCPPRHRFEWGSDPEMQRHCHIVGAS